MDKASTDLIPVYETDVGLNLVIVDVNAVQPIKLTRHRHYH